MTEVSYVPGDRTAVIADRCWVLVDTTPDSAGVMELWRRIGQTGELDELVAGLLRIGFGKVPDFALLVAVGERRRLICRGRIGATLIAGSSATRVDAAGLATWLECPVSPAVGSVVLGEPPADMALRLPATAGVLLAGSVTVGLTAALSDTVPLADPAPLGHPAPLGNPGHPTAPPETAAAQADAGDVPAEDISYDFLFGATQARTVEDAAVRPPDEAPPVAPPPTAPPMPAPSLATRPVAAPPEPLLRVQAAPPVGLLSPAGLIDAMPWEPAPADADDGSTVMRSDLLKLAATAVAPDRIGPTVQAVLCLDAHVNPPNSPVCRRCGTPLPQQDPVTIPRPVLGVLRLSTGDVVTLDRGVIMGRSPRADFAGQDGAERPHIVKLPSGEGDISRHHLRVSLDGWHVLVTDLNSTNGTLVAMPGRDAEQLRPGEAALIQPGTVVTLADGIDFRYEAAE